MLDKADMEHVPAAAEVWEKVIRKLRGNAMPPPGLPRPDKATYDSLAMYLETAIDRAAFAKPNPGRPGAHRLNRAEYAAAVSDLLAADADGTSLLPADDSDYGFDNIGDVLSVSPTLLERYLSAARTVSRLAIGEPAMQPRLDTYEVSYDLTQDDRMSEDLPLGSRGGIAVRHNFPADGEYVIKVRLKGPRPKRELDVRLDDTRLKLFSFGGEQRGRGGEEAYGERAAPDAGLEVRFPVKAGPHVVGIAFRPEDVSLPEGAFREKGRGAARAGGREPELESFAIRGPYDAKGLGETPSRRKIFVCHPDGSAGAENPIQPASLQIGNRNAGNDEEACARKILSTLARRAYRRPVTAADLQPLLGFYHAGRSEGGFEAGIEMALERVLGGPEFLFRIERDPPNAAPGAAYRVSDLELASRLSFFLWSTIPDDELLDLAERGAGLDAEEPEPSRLLHRGRGAPAEGTRSDRPRQAHRVSGGRPRCRAAHPSRRGTVVPRVADVGAARERRPSLL